jgi:hypothetical protein
LNPFFLAIFFSFAGNSGADSSSGFAENWRMDAPEKRWELTGDEEKNLGKQISTHSALSKLVYFEKSTGSSSCFTKKSSCKPLGLQVSPLPPLQSGISLKDI